MVPIASFNEITNMRQAFHWDTSFIKREEKNQLKYFYKILPPQKMKIASLSSRITSIRHTDAPKCIHNIYRAREREREREKERFLFCSLLHFLSVRSFLNICSTCRRIRMDSRYKEFHMRRNFHFLSSQFKEIPTELNHTKKNGKFGQTR